MNRDTAASEPGTQARHNGVLSPALRHGRFQPAADCREVNDRVEIPDIKPDVTRVTLQGGVRPRCAKKFKAAPPSGMEPGSPFGENLHALVIYLCFTQGIAFGRLARLPSYILGLEISEGAVVNMQDAARNTSRARRGTSARVSCREPSCNPTRQASGPATELVAVGVPPSRQRRLRR